MTKFETLMQFQFWSDVFAAVASWLHKLHVHFGETKSQLWSENPSAGNNP